jgi:hypothetical protein
MAQGPVAISLFLCEQVIIDAETWNVTPVNCFSRRTVEHSPPEPIPFVLFAVLTDGSGEISLEVRIHRLDTMDQMARLVRRYRFEDPLQEVRFILRVRGSSFPVPGHYQITLLADNEILGQRKLVILQKEAP